MQETWVGSLGGEDPRRREWQPTPVFLPRKSHGQRSLVGYSPWGHKESNTTQQPSYVLPDLPGYNFFLFRLFIIFVQFWNSTCSKKKKNSEYSKVLRRKKKSQEIPSSRINSARPMRQCHIFLFRTLQRNIDLTISPPPHSSKVHTMIP